MDIPGEIRIPIKRRRRHSSRFKAQVLKEALQPGISVAAIARHHNLNANLVHKWKKDLLREDSPTEAIPAFIPLPAPPEPGSHCQPEVRIEIPSALGAVTLSWPCDQTFADPGPQRTIGDGPLGGSPSR